MFSFKKAVDVSIATTSAKLHLCVRLLSTRCRSPSGSTWRLQSAWNTIANREFTSLNFFHAKWKRGPRLLKTIMPTINQTAVMNCHAYITHNVMKVSIMPLMSAIADIVWVAVSVWMPVCVKPSDIIFHPPVLLSRVSCFSLSEKKCHC